MNNLETSFIVNGLMNPDRIEETLKSLGVSKKYLIIKVL